jgi:prophage DNA circulation protein
MATWEEILKEGSFGGVKFDFVNISDTGTNELDKQAFPNRPGTTIKPRTANGRTFEIMAIFIDDDYPATMDALKAQVSDGGTPKNFVHPVFGTLKASCSQWSIRHDSEDAIDSATMTLTLIEHTEGDGPTAQRDTTPARANSVRSLANDVLTALSAYQEVLEVQNNTYVLQVQGAVNAAVSLADSLEATGDDLSALSVQASSNGVLALVEASAAVIADYDSSEEFDLGNALILMGSAVKDLGQDLVEARPPLSAQKVLADTNLLSLAHDLGEDAEELLTLNSFPDPTDIKAGFEVLRYAD